MCMCTHKSTNFSSYHTLLEVRDAVSLSQPLLSNTCNYCRSPLPLSQVPTQPTEIAITCAQQPTEKKSKEIPIIRRGSSPGLNTCDGCYLRERRNLPTQRVRVHSLVWGIQIRRLHHIPQICKITALIDRSCNQK